MKKRKQDDSTIGNKMTSTKVICFMTLKAHPEFDKKLNVHKCQPRRSTPKALFKHIVYQL